MNSFFCTPPQKVAMKQISNFRALSLGQQSVVGQPSVPTCVTGSPFEFNVEGGGVMSHERLSQKNAV